MLLGDPRQSDQRTQSFHFPIFIHQSLYPAAQSSAQAPSSLSLHIDMHFEVRALRTRRRVGSARRRGNQMHDHSRFQRDINDVTGVSLSLSLSLPLTKVTHAQYRKRFRASYNTIIIIMKNIKEERVTANINRLQNLSFEVSLSPICAKKWRTWNQVEKVLSLIASNLPFRKNKGALRWEVGAAWWAFRARCNSRLVQHFIVLRRRTCRLLMVLHFIVLRRRTCTDGTALLLLLFAGTIFCEFLRFGKIRKNKYPQKFLPTHLALWCIYNHKLRDVCHFGTCIIILFWSFLPFFTSFPCHLELAKVTFDDIFHGSFTSKRKLCSYRITGARCTMFHVNLHEKYIAASSVLALPHLLLKQVDLTQDPLIWVFGHFWLFCTMV